MGCKFLGVHLGTDDYILKNWEGILGKVSTRLFKLEMALATLNRAMVINNLVAASLWHKLVVLTPPRGLLKEVQRVLIVLLLVRTTLVEGSSGYFCPSRRVDKGLIDLESPVAAFRLQAAQWLLYHKDVC